MPRLSCSEAKHMMHAIRADFGVMKGELDFYAKTGDEKALKNAEQHKKFIENSVRDLSEGLGSTSLERAEKILGKDFLGPEAILKTWNVRLEAKDIPPIPFSIDDLERAKELGQFLILRIANTPVGQAFSMSRMSAMMKEDVAVDFTRYYEFDFFVKDEPMKGWYLVGKEVIPDSVNKNYLQQTEAIIDYLDNAVFAGMEYPEIYQEAIKEFHVKRDQIRSLMDSEPQEAARRLSELQITKLNRPTPVEAFYDHLVYEKNNNERLEIYSWTNTLTPMDPIDKRYSSGDWFILSQFKAADNILRSRNISDSGDFGAIFSRSQ